MSDEVRGHGSPRKLNRRAFLAAGGLGLAGALVAACGQPAPAAPTQAPAAAPTKPAAQPTPVTASSPAAAATKPAEAAPTAQAAQPAPAAAGAVKRGGTFRTTMATGLPTLNPTVSSWLGGFYNLMYDPLIRYRLVDAASRKYEYLPSLAESWEWGKDGTELTFKLRKGVKFHDGSDWNAEVAKWNFDLMMTHAKSFAKPFVESISKADVVDPLTVKLTLKAPSASLLTNLSQSTGRVYFISKAQYEKLGEEGFGQNPSGTGPFKFDTWVKENKVTLKRFEGYWEQGADGKPLPYFDGAEYRLIPEPATQLVELKAGNLDYLIIDAKDAASVKASQDLAFASVPASGGFKVVVGLNQTQGVFGKNPKLRQAALYALNRDAVNKTFGFGQGVITPYPLWVEGMIGYDSSLPSYNYDAAKAKQLLADAGFASGIDVTLTVIQRPLEQQQSEMIKQMWDQVGIRTKLEVLERTAWIAKLKEAKNFDAAFWTYVYPADPDQIGQMILTDAQSNWGSYSNPEVDKLMAAGRSTIDVAKRQEIYKNVQQIIYNDACIGCAYYLPDLAASRKALKGVEYDVIQTRFHAAWSDK